VGKLFGPALGLRASDRTIEREEQNLKMKIAAAAILMCAVMVLVAGAPLVVADTHHVVKGAQGPRASAVSWEYKPTDTGMWNGHIVNSGLRSLVVDVDDITSGAAISVLHQRIRFAAYPSSTLDTNSVLVSKTHVYMITATPNGPQGTSCIVVDVLTIIPPPVASFTTVMKGATVSVDGSGSSDPNPGATIANWGWEWGDESAASTGVTATHTYATSGTYIITLTVLSSTGMTNSISHDVVADTAPVAAFTATTSANSLVVVFDASASIDNQPIAKYDWLFGDSTIGTGVTTEHIYGTPGTYTVTLTVTDSIGQTSSVSHDVTVSVSLPKPTASFTATVSGGFTVSVDGSASSGGTGTLTYAWNYGDMITQNGVTASHSYVTTGTYTITLTVRDTLGQKGTMSQDVTVTNPNPPPFTFSLYGKTFASDGVTSLGGCAVSITDVRTGTTLIGITSDAEGGFVGDISVLYQLPGDTIVVNAVGPGGQTGSGSGVVVGTPYLGINVTLT
jgi:PKD repeat protein